MGLSIGSHVQRHEPEVLEAVIRMGSLIGKSLDPDPIFWAKVKAAIPGFKLIARFSGWQWAYTTDISPEEQAYLFLFYCKTQPGWNIADYVETPNEPFGGGSEFLMYTLYDRFMAECVILGHYAGKEVIVGQMGSGNFTPAEWRQFFPRTISVATHYGFHEYGWPRLWSQNYFEGGGHALRCIAVMAEIHKTNPSAVAHITECGVTNAVTGGQDVGYKARNYALETPEAFWNDLKWYAEHLNMYWSTADSSVSEYQPVNATRCVKSMHVFQTGGY